MFPRDDPDLDPATDANDESECNHIQNHCPDCLTYRPCKQHSWKRLHVSDSAEQSKRNKGRLGRRRLHVLLDRSNIALDRRGTVRRHSVSGGDDHGKHVKQNLRPHRNQQNPHRVINNDRHGL
jgi:hypothetical protein